MVTPPVVQLRWAKYYRLINSAYPPIDLFEDIADPRDWALLNTAESRTNPRVAATIGALDTIPANRRVGGAGASYVMAPFTHFSPVSPGRFDNGTFGAFYAANSFETALFETIHHTARFCAATAEPKGWIADKRELIGKVDCEMVDIRQGFPDLLDPDDYSASQAFAHTERAKGTEAILYPSVRDDTGLCFAAFYPDVMEIPVQGRHITYHWDGERVDMIKDHSVGQVFEIIL
jgi:hypothetical protein